jgi:hypothetical protein
LQQRRLRFSLTLTFSSTVEIFRHQLEIVRGSVEKKRTQFTCDAKFRFAANSIHFDADYHFTFTSPLSFMNANSNFALKTIRATPQSFVSSPPNARKKGTPFTFAAKSRQAAYIRFDTNFHFAAPPPRFTAASRSPIIVLL